MSCTEVALRIDLFIHDERVPVPPLAAKLEAIMSALDDLRAQVAENRNVTESAITLLHGLKQQLDDAIATGDPGALVELSAELESQSDRLAEAVSLNTPQGGGGEEPEPEPGEGEPFPPDPSSPEGFAGTSSRTSQQQPAGRRRR